MAQPSAGEAAAAAGSARAATGVTDSVGAGPAGRPEAPQPASVRTLLALIFSQLCLHSTMAGLRMAAPLWALNQGRSAWSVGVLVGLFAASQIVVALHAGCLADRHGYHRPLVVAVVLATLGGALALASTWLGAGGFVVLCGAALAAGAGANYGLIAIQRTAGRSAASATELKRVFSWLGLAPALSNVVGPVLAGVLIDLGGFRAAFVALTVLPLLALWSARSVPVEVPPPRAPHAQGRRSWDLLRAPGLRRLLLVNWLLSASWDVHSFVVPILGHERAFSASAIGIVLGVFAISVALVRLAVPVVAHRLREAQVLVVAMLATGAVFAVYPLVRSAVAMAVCAALLGLALGSVQPMIMSALHQLTPHDRHGEAIALRSMTINFASSAMPLLFGLLGTTLGLAPLFWVMGAAVAAGSFQARRIGALLAEPATAAQPPFRT